MRRVERVAAVDLAGDHDPDRRRVGLERADLHGGSVRAQHDAVAHIKGILGVERRVIVREVERVEVIALGLGFGAHGAGEAQLAEDLADLVHDLCDQMQAALPAGAARHGQVQIPGGDGGALELALARGERRLEIALQGVRDAAHGLAVLRLEARHGGEDMGERAGLAAQDLGLELLEPACIRLRNLGETLPQRVQGCQEVAHGQSAFLATSANCPNAVGSWTARSARTLRLISTPALRSPFMRRL